MTYQFDANEYADTVRLAGNAFRNADKNSSKWAQQSLAAIMLGKLSLHAVALKLYAEMKPLTAKGKPAAPKENDNGTISVSSLRGAKGKECRGGDAARKAFDKLQFIVSNAAVLPTETEAFAVSGGSLDGLVSAIKSAKAKAAKANADEAEGETTVETEGDDAPTTGEMESVAERIAEFNAWLVTVAPEAFDDAAQLALVATVRTIGQIEVAKATEMAVAA